VDLSESEDEEELEDIIDDFNQQVELGAVSILIQYPFRWLTAVTGAVVKARETLQLPVPCAFPYTPIP